jgi:hypothetical protein
MIQFWYRVISGSLYVVAIEGVRGVVKPDRSMLTRRRKAGPTTYSTAVSGKPAAILVPCSSLKSAHPCRTAQAISLPRDSQERVETAWLHTLADLRPTHRAMDLYRGRGFRVALKIATETESELYIVSAGLGLVRADVSIPAYGITLSGTGPESIAGRVEGRFDPAVWWYAISRGPFSTPLDTIFEPRSKGVIIAVLSHTYARLVCSALAAIRQTELLRLRIVGSGLQEVLPEVLRPYIMPYDDRVSDYVPGARIDLAQRALAHFVQECLAELPDADAAVHARWVSAALGQMTAPSIPVRRRCTDKVVLEIIHQYLGTGISAVRLLRVLRDQMGMACGEIRFARLYRLATARRAA